MFVLILGLIVFLGAHSLAIAGVKAGLTARLGAGTYKLASTAASLVGLALIIYGYVLYRRTGWIDVWTPPHGINHLSVLLMLAAMIALMSSFFPGEIKRRLKHPMLVAVKIWALAHLLANGDLGSILLFGSFLAWAVVDRISLKRRQPEAGLAIAPGWRTNDWLAVGVGAAVWLVFGYFLHPLLIGVAAIGG